MTKSDTSLIEVKRIVIALQKLLWYFKKCSCDLASRIHRNRESKSRESTNTETKSDLIRFLCVHAQSRLKKCESRVSVGFECQHVILFEPALDSHQCELKPGLFSDIGIPCPLTCGCSKTMAFSNGACSLSGLWERALEYSAADQKINPQFLPQKNTRYQPVLMRLWVK